MITKSPNSLDDPTAPAEPEPIVPVGIDLGTTRSAVAYVAESGRTEMLVNQHDEVFTPSVVLFEGDERIVGREAVRQMQSMPDHIAYEVKRDMGQRFYSRTILDRHLPPEVIQACILRALRGDIRRRLPARYQAVITVPAYFDESRRSATLTAGKMAELNILDIVNEPTAAALAFGERLGFLDESGQPRGELNVLVYDLGGGTFDCTIVRLAQGQITTIATDGDMRLGGSDWDQRLLTLANRKLRNQHGLGEQALEGLQSQLLRLVIEAKHTLSTRNEASLRLNVKGRAIVMNVTRNEFEEQTIDLVERTAFTTRQVLEAASAKWSGMDRLLLVGGSTRMPMIRKMLELASGKQVDTTVNPDEAVARGAAIFAQYRLGNKGAETLSDGLTITDVNAHTLGIEGLNLSTKTKENTHIISRNTPLPCVVHRKFVTKKADQRTVVIQVLEGESRSLDGAMRLGRAVIRNLPAGLPAKHPINVEYRYNSNGRLEVHANVEGHGTSAHIELQRTREISDVSLAAWKQVVRDDGGFDDIETVLMDLAKDDSSEYTYEELFPTKTASSDALAYRLGDSGSMDGLSSESGLLDDTKPLVAHAEDLPSAPAVPKTHPAERTPDESAELLPESSDSVDDSERWREIPISSNVPRTVPEPPPRPSRFATPLTPEPTTAPHIQPGPPPSPAPPQAAATADVSSLTSQAGSGGNIGKSTNLSRRSKRNGARRGMLTNMIGHILASIVGLSLGYYLLVFINPHANFLNLNLPGISSPESETPKDDPSGL